MPRAAGFVGTVKLRRAVELARPSSSLTDDLALLFLRFFSELLTISSVVLDFVDDGIGLILLVVDVDVDVDVDDVVLGLVELLSFLRVEAFAVSPPWELRLAEVLTEGVSLLVSSFSELSHGRSAIHLSNQLHPQVGLLGSMNMVFAALELVFKFCCIYI